MVGGDVGDSCVERRREHGVHGGVALLWHPVLVYVCGHVEGVAEFLGREALEWCYQLVDLGLIDDGLGEWRVLAVCRCGGDFEVVRSWIRGVVEEERVVVH